MAKSFMKYSLIETESGQERQEVAIGLKKKKKKSQLPWAEGSMRCHRARYLARESRKSSFQAAYTSYVNRKRQIIIGK